MKNSEKYQIAKALQFCGAEIAIFQNIFYDYFIENESKLSKKDSYLLALLACEFQYNVKFLKSRITEGEKKLDTSSNNIYIKKLEEFPNVIDFIIDKLKNSFETMPDDKKYEYFNMYRHSYFLSSDDIKQSLIEDIDKLIIE